MAITKFAYSWEDELSSSDSIGCKNRFQDPVSLILQSGNIIPSDAIINSAYFTVTLDYGANVESTMRVHYWPSSVTSAGWVSVSDGGINTYNNLPIISDTWYVKGISSNSETNTDINYKSSKYSYFKMTNSIPVCLSRTIYRTSTTPYAFYIRQSSQIILTVDWDDGAIYKDPNPPSNVTITPSTAILGEDTTATLSWTAASMPADATNTIVNYIIYQKNLNTGIWTNIGYTTGGASVTNYSITIPQTIGTYYYTLTTVTDEEGYDYNYTQMESLGNNYYATLTVQEEQTIGDVSGPTSIWHSLASNYIGKEGLPSTFTVGWSGASGGENNPIAGYLIDTPNENYYIDSTSTSGSKTIEAPPTAGEYYIGVKGANTSSYYGRTFTLLNITTPNNPTVYSISTPIATNTFTVQWQSVSSNYSGVSSVSYNLYYCYSGGSWSSTPLVSNITSTSYTIDSSFFASGQTFYIGVQAQFNATGAGYTRSDISSSNALIYSTSFTIPDPFWVAYYDKNNGRAQNKEDHIYDSLTLVWNKISDTTHSGYNYNLQQKKSNGAYESIITSSNVSPSVGTDSYTITNLGGETQLSYQMVITDQYGSNTWSSPEVVVKVVKPIEITNLRVDAVDANNITFYFDGQSDLPDTTNYGEVLGDFYLSYGGEETVLAQEVSLNFLTASTQREYPVSLIGKTSGTDFWGLLYNEVIINKNPWPTVKLIIRARYEAFNNSIVSSSLDYKADYTTKPSYENCFITLNRSTYYNPGDTAVATLSGFSWKDAAGGETGADIRNYLSSSISSNQFNFDASTFKTNILIPSSSEDKNVILTLNTQLTYATGSQTIISPIATNLTIARWIAEAVTISDVQLVNNTLEGYLVMPERYCASDTLGNFKEVEPILSSKTTKGVATFYGYTGSSNLTLIERTKFNLATLIKNNADEPRLIKFVYSGVDDFSDIKLYFTTTFINTTGGTLVVEAVPYRYFTADIDFAIRKGRAGLNVSKTFGTEDDNSYSTFQINAGPITGANYPIVEIFTSQETTNEAETIFLALGNAASPDRIFKKGDNIFIDNLYVETAQTAYTSVLSNLLISSNNNHAVTLSDEGILYCATSEPEFAFKWEITPNESGSLFLTTYDTAGSQSSHSGVILTSGNYSEYFTFNPTGAITTVIDNNLTANCALVSDANGKIAALSTVSSTELGHLAGVNSAIQDQLDNKLGKTETAAAATKLATGRTLKVNLASTNASTAFTGESNITNIGVSGTLLIGNGGTGATTGGVTSGGALYNLGLIYASSLPTPSYSYYGKVYLVPKG